MDEILVSQNSKEEGEMSKVDIMISKAGPGGRPTATVYIDSATSLAAAHATIQKNVTRNADLLKRLGLKACPACISGFDFDIRHRFEEVMQVDLEKVGG
jgi:hypothetical protein